MFKLKKQVFAAINVVDTVADEIRPPCDGCVLPPGKCKTCWKKRSPQVSEIVCSCGSTQGVSNGVCFVCMECGEPIPQVRTI